MTPEEEFHVQRRMFVLGNTLQFARIGDPRSHAQWLRDDYGIEKPMLRGFVDETGLYFYSTEDCRATKEDYRIIQPWLREIGEYLDLSENTPIHMGMIPGEIGVRWQPEKTLGTFRSLCL
jgi:hypothetical protein